MSQRSEDSDVKNKSLCRGSVTFARWDKTRALARLAGSCASNNATSTLGNAA